jgi:hypothetical protein
MPFWPGTYGDYCFGYAVYAASGKRVARNTSISYYYDNISPSERMFALSAGDSATTLMDIGTFAPGKYRVVVGWDALALGQGLGFAPTDAPPPSRSRPDSVFRWRHIPDQDLRDTSNSVFFVVREPSGEEAAALKAYQEYCLYASGSYWDHPEGISLEPGEERVRDMWSRIEPLGRRLIAEHHVEPYVVLTKISLIQDDYYKRVQESERAQKGLRSADPWRDSLRALYKNVLRSHPNSPIAAFFLKCCDSGSYLVEIDGEEANTAFLQKLVETYSNTVVGREAARQLSEHGRRGRQ